MKPEKGKYYFSEQTSSPEYTCVMYLKVIAIFSEQELVVVDKGSNSWYGGNQLSSNHIFLTFEEFAVDVKDTKVSDTLPPALPKPANREIEDAVATLRKHGKIKKFFGVEHL